MQATWVRPNSWGSGAMDASQMQSMWNNWSFDQLFSLSFYASFLSSQSLWSGITFFLIGTAVEAGRRFSQWLMDRFNFRLGVTARFDEGDPSYEWAFCSWYTKQGIWNRTRDFVVNAKNSKRKWGIQPGPEIDENADYVPTYESPQLFKWKGYWVEVQRTRPERRYTHPRMAPPGATIYITIYTLNVQVLSQFIAEARQGYKETTHSNVTVHTSGGDNVIHNGMGELYWSNAKHKARRPITSIILPEGVVEGLVKDIKEFISSEQWYMDAGIPHRRGFLLYGPPGTGKTSTIYALAGELGLEIYTISLSSRNVDDTYLQKAASSIPKNSIFLIEDIDCAFPLPRDAEDEDDDERMGSTRNRGPQTFGFNGMMHIPMNNQRSSVTMSGLLNVLDGVASDEGKIFFATTNHVDHLDDALCRPGRIDKKIQYFRANHSQSSGLFLRFFDRPGGTLPVVDEKAHVPLDLKALAKDFSSAIPEHEFSTAELQSYLLGHKQSPQTAVDEAAAWVAAELKMRREKAEKEAERKRKAKEKRQFGGGGGGHFFSHPSAGGMMNGSVGPSQSRPDVGNMNQGGTAAEPSASPAHSEPPVNGVASAAPPSPSTTPTPGSQLTNGTTTEPSSGLTDSVIVVS